MSTALYRRYRPETFADVIGQEHVTEPLQQALRSGRVNHAYLFSGPRGCGKTTSARILARCLNCDQGPTPDPCGECESCVALARGGPGSVDVIEIDAASHGGVDDARDLRERAAFGPAQARYKVYIIDEAHMVTSHGFNALLKVVEEPPEHVKFIFATTEPDKVLSTIRSRTHHYPFHLVPPQRLTSYLEELCTSEGVQLEAGVLSFVTRAGGGSVRDSLSVLDQLIAGAGERGLTYEGAAALLGFTDVELLDSVVDAVGAHDPAVVFRQVDRVMESGHDPRRFVEDLLERYRDLIIVAAVGERAGALLRGMPQDQVDRLRQQAGAYGPATLTRCADVVARGLSEMTGAVSYRLHLELICARLLLPAADGADGHADRLDRIERRLAAGPGTGAETTPPAAAPAPPADPGPPAGPAPAADPGPAAPAASTPTPASAPPSPTPVRAVPSPTPAPAAPPVSPGNGPGEEPPWEAEGSPPPPQTPQAHPHTPQVHPHTPQATASPSGRPRFGAPPTAQTAGPALGTSGAPPGRGPGDPGPRVRQDAPPSGDVPPTGNAPAPGGAPPSGGAPGSLDTAAVRRSWPEVLEKVKGIRRVTWTLVSVNSTVLDYDGRRVLLGLSSAGLAQTFSQGVHAEVVRQGLLEAIGLDTRVEGTVAGGDSGRGVAAGPRPGSGPGAGGASGPGAGGASGPGAGGGYGPGAGGGYGPGVGVGFGGAAGQVPGDRSTGPGAGGPSQAEQLGVTSGAGPVARAGVAPPAQEWSQSAREAPPSWATSDPPATPSGATPSGDTPAAPDPRAPETTGADPTAARPTEAGTAEAGTAEAGTAEADLTEPTAPRLTSTAGNSAGRNSTAAGPVGTEPTRPQAATGAGAPAPSEAAPQDSVPGGDIPREDDEDLESSGAVGPKVIESVLGGTVIAVDDDPTH